jgi:hypothetical protein
MSEQVPEVKIDKSAWGDGPWMTEPDRVQWEHAGYACLIVRHPNHGYLCAYVGIDRAHPFYGKNPLKENLPVDANLNYGACCNGLICHVPAPGMPADVWWLGMDFAHAFDLAPALRARERAMAARIPRLAELEKRQQELESEAPFLREIYRTVAYATAQTEALAEQLRALEAQK